MSGQHRFRLAMAGVLMTSVSFTGLAAATDTYYFRVKAPLLGVAKDLKLGVSGDTHGMVGQPFRAQVMVLKGQGPFGYSVISGSLPPGVAINSQTGEIAGSPQRAGDFSADIAVSGGMDSKGVITYSSHINAELNVSGTPDDKIISGDQYHATFVATGGDGNYSWSLDGVLPPGLSFSNGSISGTSTVLGTFDGLVVTAQDGTGAKKSSTAFSITVTDGMKTVSVSQANLVLSSMFSPSEWQSSRPKRVVIPSGVTVYSDDPSRPAVDTGASWGGTLTLQISGEVQAAGGLPVANANGGNGGDAIVTQKAGLIVQNVGAIRAGGGAGGAGGKGADGVYAVNERTPTVGTLLSYYLSPLNGCAVTSLAGGTHVIIFNDVKVGQVTGPIRSHWSFGNYDYYCGVYNFQSAKENQYMGPGFYWASIYRVAKNSPPMTSTGGSGGAGGGGRGHNQASTSGVDGAAGVGEGAGAGGAGAPGGDWGASGKTGQIGRISNVSANQPGAGLFGGTAGYAIKGTVSYSGNGIKLGL